MEMLNLTPHAIILMDDENNIIATIPPSGIVARATMTSIPDGYITVAGREVEVVKHTYGQVENLPDQVEGKVYLVSSLAAQGCKGRNDVFVPDDTVRDEKGRIIGCRNFPASDEIRKE